MTVTATACDLIFHPGAAMAAQALTDIVFVDADELTVLHLPSNGGHPVPLYRDEDYTIAGNGSQAMGTITPLAAWDADERWYVERNTAFWQQRPIPTHGPLPAASLEAGLDDAVRMAQELKRRVDRSFLSPIGESSITLPGVDARKGKVMAFDASGNPVPASIGGEDGTLREDLAQITGAAMSGADDGAGGTLFTNVQGGLDAVPARARQEIETALVALDTATDPYTLGQIINRIGLTPQMMPGFTVGASNHLAYLNAAADQIITAGGGALVLPPIAGDYKVGDAIQCHKSGYTSSHLVITGVGDKARIKRIAANKNLFALGDATNPLYYVTIKNIYSYAGVTQTGGRIFDARKANILTIKDCLFDEAYNGFYGEDLNTLQMDNVQFIMPYVASGRGVWLYSDPAGSGRTDIAVMNEVVVQAQNAGSDGWVIDGRVAGFHANWCYALGTNRGFQFTSAGTGIANIPSFCELNFCETDRAKDLSLSVSKSYRLRIWEPEFSNTSGAADVPYPQGSADHQAVYLDQGSILTSIFGGRIGNCRNQAIYDDGKATTIIGTALTDMAKDTANDYAALYTGPHADGFEYSSLPVEGFGRAKWAHQIENTANNGLIKPTRYQNLKAGGSYSTGTGAGNVTINSGVATAYSY